MYYVLNYDLGMYVGFQMNSIHNIRHFRNPMYAYSSFVHDDDDDDDADLSMNKRFRTF